MANVKYQQLSALRVKSIVLPGTYADGQGLTLRVSDTGGKRWVLRATVKAKAKNISLGTYPRVSLADARKAAADNRDKVALGLDPVAEKRAAQETVKAKAGVPTFQEAAEQVIELRRPTWSSERHAKQWTESLALHAYPGIGTIQANMINASDILAVLTPIWNSKAETATRVRQRMETVFDWCIAKGYRLDNPAGKAIARALPRRNKRVEHHPALHYNATAACLDMVRASTGESATKAALEFMILTAARTSEVRGAVWSEIDFEARTWEIPADRMKARRAHRVPLSDRTIEILRAMQALGRKGDVIFQTSRSKGGPMSNMALEMLLRRLSIPCVPHGFRTSFRTWCQEQSGASWAACEASLAHRLGNQVAGAYARSDMLAQRRPLMEQWADFLSGDGFRLPATEDNLLLQVA